MIAAGLVLSLLAASPASLEAQAADRVRREFERVGRSAPQLDPALTAAARTLAVEALRRGPGEATDMLVITQAVSDANGQDPTPRAVVIRSTPPEVAIEKFIERADLSQEPATQMGIGVVFDGEQGALVALLSERKATLRPFPRRLTGPAPARALCGELLGVLHNAELFVTRPSGAVEKLPLSQDDNASFCANIAFPAAGRHNIEVVGRGPHGPEVAAMFFVDVGVVAADSATTRAVEPITAAEARPLIAARINALRTAQQLGSLEPDPRLDAVAQQYADKMVAEGFFAHIAPDGSDVRKRLLAAGYRYARAGENLGSASGPLSAHFAIEHSPGHRKNLLEPDFTHVGVGVSFDRTSSPPQAVVVEVLARPLVASSDPLGDAYRAVAQLRATRHLPALRRSEVLEEMAMAHARKALALDRPKAELPSSHLHDQVFSALTEVRQASVDFFVADQPSALPDSKSLSDALNDQVGIGAVRGDSPTFGKDKFWVVVIYTASRERR